LPQRWENDLNPPTIPSPLDGAIGLTFLEHDAGVAVLRLEPAAAAYGSDDQTFLHGGTLATCVDTAGWYAVVAQRPGTYVAVDLRTDFLRLAGPGSYRVTATCLRAGRTLATADVTIAPWDDPARPCAVGRVAYIRTGD
jgi:uncharacterized protein (TIGR00369 family)